MPITGATLLQLAAAYCEAINTGGVPCIELAWTSVCKSECQRSVQEAVHNYKRLLQERSETCGQEELAQLN